MRGETIICTQCLTLSDNRARDPATCRAPFTPLSRSAPPVLFALQQLPFILQPCTNNTDSARGEVAGKLNDISSPMAYQYARDRAPGSDHAGKPRTAPNCSSLAKSSLAPVRLWCVLQHSLRQQPHKRKADVSLATAKPATASRSSL